MLLNNVGPNAEVNHVDLWSPKASKSLNHRRFWFICDDSILLQISVKNSWCFALNIAMSLPTIWENRLSFGNPTTESILIWLKALIISGLYQEERRF